jgi:hypothetical protein
MRKTPNNAKQRKITPIGPVSHSQHQKSSALVTEEKKEAIILSPHSHYSNHTASSLATKQQFDCSNNRVVFHLNSYLLAVHSNQQAQQPSFQGWKLKIARDLPHVCIPTDP